MLAGTEDPLVTTLQRLLSKVFAAKACKATTDLAAKTFESDLCIFLCTRFHLPQAPIPARKSLPGWQRFPVLLPSLPKFHIRFRLGVEIARLYLHKLIL